MNPLLQQTEQAILAKVNPQQLVPAVQKIVAEGKRVMYSPQTRQMLTKQLSQATNLPHVVGEGVAKLIAMLVHQAPQAMPPQAMIPAATLLLCEALDFLEQAGKVQVTNEILAASMKEMSASLMQLFGVTPEKMQALIAKNQAMGGAQGSAPGAANPSSQAPAGGSLIAQARGGAA